MNTITIGIAGGTGSGKSTFTNRLKRYFGDRISVLYHDNYYKTQDDIPFEERVKVNYDHPDALETDLFVEHLRALKNGQTILCPVYDYTVHNRSDEVIEIKPSRIILVEGILVLYDPRVRDLLDIKVYVEADADERILRRVLRDVDDIAVHEFDEHDVVRHRLVQKIVVAYDRYDRKKKVQRAEAHRVPEERCDDADRGGEDE